MYKRFLGIALCSILCIGCAVTYEQQEIVEDPAPQVRRFMSTHQLQLGLTSDEAKAVLGEEVIIGYEMPDSRKERYKPIVINNPQRREEYVQGKNQYIIEYYLIGINHNDAKVTDDELTPLVFEDDQLVGWGWDFLNRIKE